MPQRGTVLVTGATGFLGSHLCAQLLDEGYHVVALKRSTSNITRIDPLRDRLETFDVDRQPLDDVVRRGSGVTAIVHAAANYGRNGEGRDEVFEANCSFPHELLTLAVEAGVGTFVNSDTVLPRAVSLYSEAKREFLDAARRLVPQRGQTRLVNMRLQYVYGPGDADEKFVTHVVKACASNAPVLRLTRGEQRRDFVFVDDVVSAYLLVLGRRDELTEPFTEYDVGTGHAVPVREFVELIHRLTQSRTRLDFGAVPYRPNEVMFAQADVAALTSLGWLCRASPESGVRKTIERELVLS